MLYDHDITLFYISKISICYVVLCTILEKTKSTKSLTPGLTVPSPAAYWVALTKLFLQLILPFEAVYSLLMILLRTWQSIHFIKQSRYRKTLKDYAIDNFEAIYMHILHYTVV